MQNQIGMNPSNIKIFVLQHMNGELPTCYRDRSTYQPIQCGRVLNPPIPGTIGDDDGDNISELNVRYNEMTAIYWIAKHLDQVGNPEYIGFDHYRRFLNWKPEWLAPKNVIARRWFSWRTLRSQYALCHEIADLDRFSERLMEKMGGEYSDYPAYWMSHGFYICNLFIMHRDQFHRYSEFILSCIEILREMDRTNPLITSTPHHSRVPGYILEEMTSFWIWHERRIGRIHVFPSTITHFPIENTSNGGSTLNRREFLWFLRHAY